MISSVRHLRASLAPVGAIVLTASLAGCNLASTLPRKGGWSGVRAETAATSGPAIGSVIGSRATSRPSSTVAATPPETANVSVASIAPSSTHLAPAELGAGSAASPSPSGVAPDLWAQLVEDLGLVGALSPSQHRIRRWLRANRRHVHEVLARSATFLPHILRAVHERGLPGEIALIPAVESGYRSNVRSADGAEGLWQFMPDTAARYGLRRTWWYDGRRDVVAATRAALDYLETLNARFEGNWLISLAAYNCGEGAMERALARAGVHAHDADLWALMKDLPPETREYVPRLLALAELVRTPERYGVKLPRLPAGPSFTAIDTGGQIDIALAAHLIGLNPAALRTLNPGFLRWATDPAGPYRLLVPPEHADALREALHALPPDGRMVWDRHRVRAGESLSTIAHRYRVRVRDLQVANHLTGTLIRTGHTLLVPRSEPTAPVRSASSTAPSPAPTYRVRAGDSLWKIARRHHVTVERLLRLNGLNRTSVLHPGQILRVT